MNARREKQIEAYELTMRGAGGPIAHPEWRYAPLIAVGFDGVTWDVPGALVRGAFAVHPAADDSDVELWLRLTHLPTGMRMASGADPLALIELAAAWEPACDWAQVRADGIPAEAIKDAEFVARLDDLRRDFETWQRGLVRAEAAAT